MSTAATAGDAAAAVADTPMVRHAGRKDTACSTVHPATDDTVEKSEDVPRGDATVPRLMATKSAILLSSLTAATGNAITASRIATLIEQEGYAVTMWDVHEERAARLADSKADLVIGIHANRAGPLLQTATCPTILVMGGSEVSLAPGTPKAKAAIEAAQAASCIVMFSVEFLTALQPAMGAHFSHVTGITPEPGLEAADISTPVHVIPQAVDCSAPSPAAVPAELRDVRQVLGLPASATVLLCVAGLRPIKAPLFLHDMVTQWHADSPDMHFLLVGPPLDADMTAAVFRAVGRPADAGAKPSGCRGFWYHPPVSHATLRLWMTQADVVINTSVSEGMANCVMEAMALGTVVVARTNAGNKSLISHGVNGLLYSTPEEWRSCVSSVLSDPTLRRTLTTTAMHHMRTNFCTAREQAAWHDVILSVTQ